MHVNVDVFSDVICPWCFVGKKRLERAMAELARDHSFQVVWHPFELNPQTPAEGISRRGYLERKFGGPERLRAIDLYMKDIGRAEGIDFHQENIAKVPNTLAAHRLIWWAGQEGRQNAVVEKLFHGYFSDGAEIGAPAVLARLAAEAGLDPQAAAAFLAGEGGKAEVQAEEAAIRSSGIRGVPLFILNGGTMVEGAEPPEYFVQAITELAAKSQAPAT